MRSKKSSTCLRIVSVLVFSLTQLLVVSGQTRRGTPRISIPTEIPIPSPEKPGKSDKNSKNKSKDAVNETGQEYTIDLIGLKIRDVRYSIQGETRLVPTVIAVLENSTAFYEGISPGDVIGRAQLTDWPRSHELARYVYDDFRYDELRTISIRVYYPVEGSLRLDDKGYNLKYIRSDKTTWLTTAPKHTRDARSSLPGLEEARVALKTEFDQLRKDTENTIQSSPCSMVGPPIASRIQNLTRLARLTRYPYSLEGLKGLSETACGNYTNGEVSNAELVIRLVSEQRRLNPCSYDPTKNYRETINNLDFSTRVHLLSKTSYDENQGPRNALRYYLRDSEPKERECMLGVLKSLFLATKNRN